MKIKLLVLASLLVIGLVGCKPAEAETQCKFPVAAERVKWAEQDLKVIEIDLGVVLTKLKDRGYDVSELKEADQVFLITNGKAGFLVFGQEGCLKWSVKLDQTA